MTKSSKKRSKSVQYKNQPLNPQQKEEHKEAKIKKTAVEEGLLLSQLQDKIKRLPELYKKEFQKHFLIFKEKMQELKDNPGKKNEQLEAYMKFVSHVSAVFKEEIVEYLSEELINMLQQYYSILHPSTRMTMVTCLKILRGKDLVLPQVVLPVFFKLFKCEQKELRQFLEGIIISDLKKINLKHKNHGVNKKLQAFIFDMLQDQNETASKKSLNVMMQLYRKRIWNDEKTINVIAQGCLHNNPKIVAASCKFFILVQLDDSSDSEDSSDEETGDKLSLIKHHKGSKMTSHRKKRIEKAVKKFQRKEKRKSKVKNQCDFLPIDLIHDPQNFCEKMFAKLRKSQDKYEVKLLMMRLISRMIGRNQLLLLQFYPHILRYLQAHDKDKIAEIFAMIIESCHELVPPEELRPIIEKIMTNFLTEYCSDQNITIGLNTIREILTRMPLALEESQIEYLLQFKGHKNMSVKNAAKSLINFFRDVCPELLPKKFRGRFTDIDEDNAKETVNVYGRQKVFFDIDGIEHLKQAYDVPAEVNLAAEKILDDKDFKKIRYLKLKKAVTRNNKQKFEDSDIEEESKGRKEELSEESEEEGESEIESEDGEGEELSGEEDEELSGEEEEEEEDEDESFGEESEEEEEEKEKEQKKEGAKKVQKKEKKTKSKIEGQGMYRDLLEDQLDEEEEELRMREEEDLNMSDISSSQLEEDSDDAADPRGFVFAHNLNTYNKSKRERILEQQNDNDKEEHRAKFQRKKDKKNGGKSNREKLKNKPFMMVKKKKLESMSSQYQSVKSKIKGLKKQLGKFKKNQKQKIEAKKRRKIK